MTQITTPLHHLQFLFGDEVSWKTQISTFHVDGEKRTSRFFASCEAAADAIESVKTGEIYFRITLVHDAGLKGGQRGGTDITTAVTCLWADLDVKPGAFTSIQDAADFSRRMPLYPSLIVCSGYGVHVKWNLNEPLTKDFERFTKGWHGLAKEMAADRCVTIENLGDLARVLRPVGSFNRKYGTEKPVYVIEQNDRRYYASDFEPFLKDIEAVEKANSATPKFNDAIDDATLSQLMMNGVIRSVWGSNGEAHDPSGVDYAVAVQMAIGDYTDEQIAATLYRRRRDCTPPGFEPKLGKIRRASYIVPTLAGARKAAAEHKREAALLGLVNLSRLCVPAVAAEPAEGYRLKSMDDETFPSECLCPGGLIERIMDQNLSSAMYPMPQLALAGALSLMAVITGRKIQDRRGLRTNAYFLGLAPASGGKNNARQNNANILMRLGAEDMLGPTKLKSSAGLVSVLKESPACLFQLDEISRLLHTMKNPKEAPHLYDIGTIMLEAWSEANTLWKPGAYAEAKKNPVINQPHLVIYGTAVAKEFWTSLTVGSLEDGLVGRMMVFESPMLDDVVELDGIPTLCESLLAEAESWLSFDPMRNQPLIKGHAPEIVQHTPEAWDRQWNHIKQIVKGKPNESESVRGIWRRSGEKTGKLALLKAASDSPPIIGRPVVIGIDAVNWAIRLSNWLTNRLLKQAGLYVAENVVHDNLNRILRMLGDWTSTEEIGQRVKWIKAKERTEILKAAVDDGLIVGRVVSTSGRPKTEYIRRDRIETLPEIVAVT